MDDSSSDIETHLPDLGAFQLDEVAMTANRTLRQVARRLAREATRTGMPLAGFSASAVQFNEADTSERPILPTTAQATEESSEFQRPPAGSASSVTMLS